VLLPGIGRSGESTLQDVIDGQAAKACWPGEAPVPISGVHPSAARSSILVVDAYKRFAYQAAGAAEGFGVERARDGYELRPVQILIRRRERVVEARAH
jgi:hypothetical protein